MSRLIYAGVGSRTTPPHILTLMTSMARWLDGHGYTLRSGGAVGADSAFAAGSTRSTLFLPGDAARIPAWAAMAALYHPAWDRCSAFARNAHARNCAIVLGPDLDTPVDFVVCWTAAGAVVGGTGQALRMALALHIPVVNLGTTTTLAHLPDIMTTLVGQPYTP